MLMNRENSYMYASGHGMAWQFRQTNIETLKTVNMQIKQKQTQFDRIEQWLSTTFAAKYTMNQNEIELKLKILIKVLFVYKNENKRNTNLLQ